MRLKSRTTFAITACLLAMGTLAQGAAAQDFPNKELKLVVPYAPGGSTDVLARLYADKLGKELGKRVIIENRPGAAAVTGTRSVLQAPADGYTLLLGTPILSTAALTVKDPGFQFDDFKAIASLGDISYMLTVNPSMPVKSLAEFIDYAKKNPNTITNGQTAVGGSQWFLTERFKHSAGITLRDVQYPGANNALTDVIAGHINAIFSVPLTLMPLVQDGKLRALAIATENRLEIAKDIPTFKELGLPDIVGGVWYGSFVSAKTPADVVTKLREASQKALADPEVKKWLVDNGFVPGRTSIAAFETYIAGEQKTLAADAKRLNLQPQ